MENNSKIAPANEQDLICINNEADKKQAFEQYKILAQSIDNSNGIREAANNFWITVNSLLISGVAYLRGFEGVDRDQYAFLIWSSLVLGIGLCCSWLSSLISIKKSIDTRNHIMIEIEKNLPAKIFTACLGNNQNVENKRSITIKEMLVPSLFIIGYAFFLLLLIWIPNTILGKAH